MIFFETGYELRTDGTKEDRGGKKKRGGVPTYPWVLKERKNTEFRLACGMEKVGGGGRVEKLDGGC